MKTITCKNNWVRNNPSKVISGNSERFVHGIQVKEGTKLLHEITFPFEVSLTKSGIRFLKDDVETYVGFDELSQDRDTVKALIRSCAIGTYGTPMQRKTVVTVVDTDPINTIVLPLDPGETHAGIYDVYAPQYVNEGSEDEDYQIDLSGNVVFNTEIPVEPEPYVITINYWVTFE